MLGDPMADIMLGFLTILALYIFLELKS